jgi:glycosyltransferase involved in cell wall biosynthesis
MEITTIIPTFNRSHLIKRAINSALNQTYPHIKVIVYDNASQDNTEEIVSHLVCKDSRVHYVKHSHPISAVENFQFGISNVTTPFFSLLADDDILLPNFYQLAIAKLSQYLNAACFLGSAIDLHETGTVLGANALSWPDQEYFSATEALSYLIAHYVNWTAALFRTNIAQPIQLDSRLKAIDFDFLIRLCSHHALIFSKQPCALFIHHPNSYSYQSSIKIFWPGWNIISQTINSDPILSNQIKMKVSNLLLFDLNQRLHSLAITFFFHKKFASFLEIFKINPSFSLRILFLFRFSFIFGFIKKTRNLLLNLKRHSLQKNYGHYSKWLQM